MKKITLFFLLSLLATTFGVVKAQTVQDGVLISWPMASGDIKMPDEVVEIAPNCFYQSGGDWAMTIGNLPVCAVAYVLRTTKLPLSTSTT